MKKYKNLFEGKKNEGLKELYKGYQSWHNENEEEKKEDAYEKMREEYRKMDLLSPIVVMELDMLREIAKRWADILIERVNKL